MRTSYISNTYPRKGPPVRGLESLVLLAVVSAGVSGATAIAVTVGAIVGAIQIGVSVGLSFLASSLFKPDAPQPQDVQTSVKNPIAPRIRHYGRVKTSGPWAFVESKSGNLHKVITLGTGQLDAIEEYWVDDNLVTLGAGGWVTEPDLYSPNNLRIIARVGLPTETHYSELTSVFPEWDSSHRGDGVSSLYAYQDAVSSDKITEIFPNITNTLYRVVARGSLVYNPATATTIWTDNAAAIERDYLTHADGMRLPASIVNTPLAAAGWLAAYNRCAEDVELKAGGTEDRYRLWGSYQLDERPADVLSRMNAACDGRLVPTPDGGLTLDVGTWEEPSVTLDADAITGFSDVARGRDVLTTANIIRATYTSPFHDYQSTDADQWIDEEDVVLRGEIAQDTAFNMAPSHSQARRLMKLAAYRANPSWVGVFQCNLRAMACFGKRFVRISYPLFGINEVFEIQDFRFNIDEGGILTGVSLQVQSMPAEAYAWDADTEEGTEPISEETTVDNTIPVPTGLTFTQSLITVAGQNVAVGIISFDAAPTASLIVQARYKLVDATDWTTVPVAPEATQAQTGALSDGSPYEAQVRFVTQTGRVGDWTDSATLTPISDSAPPLALASFSATGGNGNATFGIATASGDLHLSRIAVYRVPNGVTLNKAAHTKLTIAAAPGTSFSYVDGDATTVNLFTDPGFATGSGWSFNAGWSRNAGTNRADHASAAVAGVAQSFTYVAGTYRGGFDIEAQSAAGTGAFPYFGSVTTPVSGTAVSGIGTKLWSLVPDPTAITIAVRASTWVGSIDNMVAFKETSACAPQGVWDYYPFPLNASGIEGPAATPVTGVVVY